MLPFVVLNTPTFLMAAAWFFFFFIASAIGAKSLSVGEYLSMLWPALIGSALGMLSVVSAYFSKPILATASCLPGLAVMPIAFNGMLP